MKTLYRTIVLVVFAVFAISCTKNNTLDVSSDESVRLTTQIVMPLDTRVTEDGMQFTVGDEITVYNSSRGTNNLATYKLSGSNTWDTSDLLFWEGMNDNMFYGSYPANASYDKFTIPADQSLGVGMADWMTTGPVTAKRSDGALHLPFYHKLSKVTVNISKIGSQFDGTSLRSAHLLSLITTIDANGESADGDTGPQYVSAMLPSVADSFTAIVAPGEYPSGTDIMKLYLVGKDAPLVVKSKSVITLVKGNAYVFNLTIGKDVVEFDETGVSVIPWGDIELNEVTAEEIVYLELVNSQDNITLDFEGGDITVPVKTNVQYEIKNLPDWITYSSMTENGDVDNLKFKVAKNLTEQDRTAKVSIESLQSGLSLDVTIVQSSFNGIDDSSFDDSKYLVYTRNAYKYTDDDDSYSYASYFSHSVEDFGKIEFKFQLPEISENAAYTYALASTNYAKDDYTEITIGPSYGIEVTDISSDNVTRFTWDQLDVNYHNLIVLTIDSINKTLSINGRVVGDCVSLTQIGYLFSEYYSDTEDGERTLCHDGFYEGTKIYYVKIWDKQQRLIYLAGPEMYYNSKTGKTEASLSSAYYNGSSILESNEFAYYHSSNKANYQPFGRGNL